MQRGVGANPYANRKRPPCVKGDSPQCGEMSRSDRGVRPRKRSADRRWGIVTSRMHRPTLTRPQSLRLRFAQPPPFTQGRLLGGCRGEQCSPAEPGAATKLPRRIVNPPLREPKRPPLRGGSRASGWGRETYLVLKFRINARALSLSPLCGQLPHRGSQSGGITTFYVTCRGRRPRRPGEPGGNAQHAFFP